VWHVRGNCGTIATFMIWFFADYKYIDNIVSLKSGETVFGEGPQEQERFEFPALFSLCDNSFSLFFALWSLLAPLLFQSSYRNTSFRFVYELIPSQPQA
jgi:hypothetical protein